MVDWLIQGACQKITLHLVLFVTVTSDLLTLILTLTLSWCMGYLSSQKIVILSQSGSIAFGMNDRWSVKHGFHFKGPSKYTILILKKLCSRNACNTTLILKNITLLGWRCFYQYFKILFLWLNTMVKFM